MRKFVLLILAAILLAVQPVYSAGLLSDVYANRVYDNYRHYSAMNLSPSMTTEVDQFEVGGSISYLSQIETSNLYGYALFPLGLRGTVGFAYYSPGMFKQEQITTEGTRTGQTFTVGERVFAFNGAYRLSNLSLGMNLNINTRKDVDYIQGTTNLEDKSNTLIGLDLGATFYPFENADLGGIFGVSDLDIGVTAQNILGPVFKLDKNAGEDETAMPNILLNYRFNFMDKASILSGDFSLQSVEQIGLSIDYIYEFPAFIGVGAGYIKGFQSENFVNLTGELRLQHLVNRLSRLTIQVGSGISKEDITNLDFTYKAAFMAKLYKTREELNAERMYNLAKIAPMKAYEEALEYYKKKLYWKAAFKFGYVIAKYPRFYNVDAANYYMASSFEKLNLNSIAKDIYSKAADKFTTSDWRAKLLVGEENIKYKDGDLSGSYAIYKQIEDEYSQNDAINEARYIASSVKNREADYNKAIELADGVSSGSSFWMYAQYSKAIALLAKEQRSEAINALKNTVSVQIAENDGAGKEMQNKANIMMGHVYQEIAKEKKSTAEIKLALERYSLVSNNSVFFEEALLGISWIFIKSRKGNEAMKYIDQLVSIDGPYKAEALLLQGYAYTFIEDYKTALKKLEAAVTEASRVISASELSSAKNSREDAERKMTDLGEKARDFALTRIKLNREQKRDLMGDDFVKLSENYTKTDSELLDLERRVSFRNNYQTVLEDAEYAQGVVNILVIDQIKKEELEKSKLDAEKKKKEMEELQKQMENIK